MKNLRNCQKAKWDAQHMVLQCLSDIDLLIIHQCKMKTL